jgi:hypothetical protein
MLVEILRTGANILPGSRVSSVYEATSRAGPDTEGTMTAQQLRLNLDTTHLAELASSLYRYRCSHPALTPRGVSRPGVASIGIFCWVVASA